MDKGIIIHSLIVYHGKILILKRVKNTYLGTYWDSPGGTLEDGEDPVDGAVREAKEETGLDIFNLILFYYNSKIDKAKNKQFITLIFLAECKGNPYKVIINRREHDAFKWINLNQMASYKAVPWLTQCLKVLTEKKHPLIKITGKKHQKPQ